MCHQEQGISRAVLPFLGIQAGHGGAVALTNGISGPLQGPSQWRRKQSWFN